LTYEGLPEQNIGRHITAYFRSTLNLNVTTTSIRSLVETTVDQQATAGTVTMEQRTAVSAINGHSSKITEEHYVRKNYSTIVAHGRAAFGMEPLQLPAPVPVQAEKWGAVHPDSESTRRARWTQDEKEYLQEVAFQLLRDDFTRNSPMLVSLCLKAIKADKRSRPIFHVRHILTTDRLKAGLPRDFIAKFEAMRDASSLAAAVVV
jgi:hypothetical protein